MLGHIDQYYADQRGPAAEGVATQRAAPRLRSLVQIQYGCSESGLVNCQKVTTSPQSYVSGIPVAVLGLAFYAFAVPVMSPWAWRPARRENMVTRWAWHNLGVIRLASVLAGVGFVLYLLYAELFIIGSICLYCTSVHVITFLLFVLTVFAAAAWGLRPGQPAPDS